MPVKFRNPLRVFHRTLHTTEEEFDHPPERDTTEYRRSRALLMREHGRCLVCGGKDHLQAHHFLAKHEWADQIDFKKLKAWTLKVDPYGYGHRLDNVEITTVDDVRNLVLICRLHHIRRNTGIHETTWNDWVFQAIAKEGFDPIPRG